MRQNALSAMLAVALCAASMSVAVQVQAKEISTIRFGVEAAYPPFESKAADGQLQGFDIDLGNALCAQLKAKCVWVENAFDGLIPALQARKFDAIDSAMNINAKRSEQIDFTQPLYRTPPNWSHVRAAPCSLRRRRWHRIRWACCRGRSKSNTRKKRGPRRVSTWSVIKRRTWSMPT